MTTPPLPRPARFRALALAALWLCAPVAGAAPDEREDPFWVEAPAARAREMSGSLADLAARVGPAVIALQVTQRGGLERDPAFGILRRQRGPTEVRGSAFLISRDGYALTASSLLAGAESLVTELPDGRALPAKVIGQDRRGGVALLKLETSEPLPALALGSSARTAVGDWVIALGHADEREWEPDAGGHHLATLAKGVVAGLERRVESSEARLLQTDLVLVRGYSGAPLVDMNGAVVGILAQDLQPEGVLGISFAIPIDDAKRVLGQLRSTGRVQRGWLGVQIQPLSGPLAKRLGLANDDGALVSEVLEGTPAERARILPGDVIVEVEGIGVARSSELPPAVSRHAPGAKVRIALLRDGRRRELSAVLGTPPEPDPEPELPAPQSPAAREPEPWGFATEILTPALAARYGLPEGSAGIVVTAIDEGGPADRAGLAPGDLLREANGSALSAPAQLAAALGTPEPLLRVQRGANTVYRVLERR